MPGLQPRWHWQVGQMPQAGRLRRMRLPQPQGPWLRWQLRLVRLLQTLREVYGQPVPQGVLLQLKISQSDLGDWLGVSRQRANFAVQQLRKDGMIELRYSTITITDPQRLAACARL